jgi:hypothetical protein
MDPNHFKDDDSADITDVEALDIADYSLTPTKAAMDDAARAIHEALTALQQDYYIFGGYACIKLTASSRTTQDLDIVVPNHATRAWQDNDPFHKTKEGYVYLSHRDMCQIGLDIMVGGFQAFPSPDHAEIVEVDGIRFLGRKQQLMLHFQRFSLGKGPKIEENVSTSRPRCCIPGTKD